ncbi:MAG: hypothetical protein WD696_00705 [Bryobacteraceae bacterium]
MTTTSRATRPWLALVRKFEESGETHASFQRGFPPQACGYKDGCTAFDLSDKISSRERNYNPADFRSRNAADVPALELLEDALFGNWPFCGAEQHDQPHKPKILR